MRAIPIADLLTVSGQVSTADIETLRAGRVTTLINTRPDREDPGQPDAATIRAQAERAGLAYHHIPVSVGTIAPADIDAFGAALAASTGPVHAHCKSGLRAAVLWGLDRVRNHGADPADTAAGLRSAGFDPAALLHTLQRLA